MLVNFIVLNLGVRDNMTLTGRFHAHMTVGTQDDHFQAPRGWKTTIITLSRGDRQQKDVMITRHFMVGNEKHPDVDSVLNELDATAKQLAKHGQVVIRTKLEHEDLPTVGPSLDTYRECHIKIRKPIGVSLVPVVNYVQSRNPMVVTDTHETVFLNARFYNGTNEGVDSTIDSAVRTIGILNPGCEILEVKKETTVYDTNHKLDKWWA